MKVASVAAVKSNLSAFLHATKEGPVVVTRNGRAVAVLLAVEDDDELERLLMAYSPRLRGILDAARDRVQAGKGVPHEEFWGEVEDMEKPKTTKPRNRLRPKAVPAP